MTQGEEAEVDTRLEPAKLIPWTSIQRLLRFTDRQLKTLIIFLADKTTYMRDRQSKPPKIEGFFLVHSEFNAIRNHFIGIPMHPSGVPTREERIFDLLFTEPPLRELKKEAEKARHRIASRSALRTPSSSSSLLDPLSILPVKPISFLKNASTDSGDSGDPIHSEASLLPESRLDFARREADLHPIDPLSLTKYSHGQASLLSKGVDPSLFEVDRQLKGLDKLMPLPASSSSLSSLSSLQSAVERLDSLIESCKVAEKEEEERRGGSKGKGTKIGLPAPADGVVDVKFLRYEPNERIEVEEETRELVDVEVEKKEKGVGRKEENASSGEGGEKENASEGGDKKEKTSEGGDKKEKASEEEEEEEEEGEEKKKKDWQKYEREGKAEAEKEARERVKREEERRERRYEKEKEEDERRRDVPLEDQHDPRVQIRLENKEAARKGRLAWAERGAKEEVEEVMAERRGEMGRLGVVASKDMQRVWASQNGMRSEEIDEEQLIKRRERMKRLMMTKAEVLKKQMRELEYDAAFPMQRDYIDILCTTWLNTIDIAFWYMAPHKEEHRLTLSQKFADQWALSEKYSRRLIIHSSPLIWRSTLPYIPSDELGESDHGHIITEDAMTDMDGLLIPTSHPDGSPRFITRKSFYRFISDPLDRYIWAKKRDEVMEIVKRRSLTRDPRKLALYAALLAAALLASFLSLVYSYYDQDEDSLPQFIATEASIAKTRSFAALDRIGSASLLVAQFPSKLISGVSWFFTKPTLHAPEIDSAAADSAPLPPFSPKALPPHLVHPSTGGYHYHQWLNANQLEKARYEQSLLDNALFLYQNRNDPSVLSSIHATRSSLDDAIRLAQIRTYEKQKRDYQLARPKQAQIPKDLPDWVLIPDNRFWDQSADLRFLPPTAEKFWRRTNWAYHPEDKVPDSRMFAPDDSLFDPRSVISPEGHVIEKPFSPWVARPVDDLHGPPITRETAQDAPVTRGAL